MYRDCKTQKSKQCGLQGIGVKTTWRKLKESCLIFDFPDFLFSALIPLFKRGKDWFVFCLEKLRNQGHRKSYHPHQSMLTRYLEGVGEGGTEGVEELLNWRTANWPEIINSPSPVYFIAAWCAKISEVFFSHQRINYYHLLWLQMKYCSICKIQCPIKTSSSKYSYNKPPPSLSPRLGNSKIFVY